MIKDDKKIEEQRINQKKKVRKKFENNILEITKTVKKLQNRLEKRRKEKIENEFIGK